MYSIDIREIDIARTIKNTPILYINGIQYKKVSYGVFELVAKPDKRAGSASKAAGSARIEGRDL